MKTLRRLVAVVLLAGSYQVGIAQSNSTPDFKSDAEKHAWIQANPEKYNELTGKKLQWQSQEEHRAWVESHPVEYKAMIEESLKTEIAPRVSKAYPSTERFASEAEKTAWIEANPEAYREMTGEKLQWNSQEEYHAWVNSHPAEHKAMLEESRKLEIAPRVTKVLPTAERFSSEAEKAAWIKANPEEYKRLNSGSNNK